MNIYLDILIFATYDDSHVFTKYRIWYVKHEHLSGHCSDGCYALLLYVSIKYIFQ